MVNSTYMPAEFDTARVLILDDGSSSRSLLDKIKDAYSVSVVQTTAPDYIVQGIHNGVCRAVIIDPLEVNYLYFCKIVADARQIKIPVLIYSTLKKETLNDRLKLSAEDYVGYFSKTMSVDLLLGELKNHLV